MVSAQEEPTEEYLPVPSGARVWEICFIAHRRGLRYLVNRADCRHLSVFRIGYDLFERLMTNQQPIQVRLLPYF